MQTRQARSLPRLFLMTDERMGDGLWDALARLPKGAGVVFLARQNRKSAFEAYEAVAKKIEKSHKDNPAFKKAFADFFELCRTSLNPNISQAAVDEMLIQHILTERLIRTFLAG